MPRLFSSDEPLYRLFRTVGSRITTAEGDTRRTIYRTTTVYRGPNGMELTCSFEIEPERIAELVIPQVATHGELLSFARQWYADGSEQFELAVNDEVAVRGRASRGCYIANMRRRNGVEEYLVVGNVQDEWVPLYALALVRAWRDVPAEERARL